MQKITVVILFFLFCTASISAQYYDEDSEVSTEPRTITKRFETQTWKTAYTLPRKQLHLSLLAPIRYGLVNDLELQSFLGLWAYKVPNFYLKKKWLYFLDGVLLFSSKHGIAYPTKGLEIFRKDNRDHTLNDDAKIPQIFTFQNELIASYIINPTCNIEEALWIASARLGVDISFTGKRDVSFNRMTFFSFYNRTASFYGDKVFYLGVQLDGGWLKNLYFNGGVDVYAIGFGYNGIEAQGNFIYHYNQFLSFSAGIKFIMTRNPLEKEMNFAPMLDVCYRFGKQKKWQKGLLER